MKKKVVLLLPLMVIILGLWISSTRGSLRLQVESASEPGSLTLKNKQNKAKEYEISQASTSISLPSGRYTGFYESGEGRYFVNVVVPGFFQSTSITVSVGAQHSHEYAANKPKPCIYLGMTSLYSSPCSGLLSEMVYHTKANQSNPSYALPVQVAEDGYIEGYIEEDSRQYLLVKSLEDDRHKLYQLFDNGSLSLLKVIGGLNEKHDYRVADIDNGFIAYDLAQRTAVKISSINTSDKGEEVKINQETDLPMKQVDASSDNLLALFSPDPHTASDFSEVEEAHSNELDERYPNESVLAGYKSSKTTSIRKSQKLHQAAFCLSVAVCAIDEQGMYVYDFDEDLEEIDYIPGARDFSDFGDRLIVTFADTLVDYQPGSSGGKVIYSAPPGYLTCGTKTLNEQLFVCIENDRDRSIISLDTQKEATVNISHIIAQLMSDNAIETVSVQGKFVHVSPHLGAPTFQEDIQEIGYSLEEIASARANLENAITESGLKPAGYTVVTNF